MKLWATLWLSIALTLFFQSAALASEVKIVDDMQSCFGSKHVVSTYSICEQEFVDKKKKSIPPKDLLELIDIIRKSKNHSIFSCEDLGITPDLVKLHREQLIKSSIYANTPIYKKVPINHSTEFEFEAICQGAKQRLTQYDHSTTHLNFSLTIDAPDLLEEKITVSSIHDVPYMLPWKVKMGDKKWESYSLDLTKKLNKLADSAGFCAALLNDKFYWEKNFWTDSKFWSIYKGHELFKQDCLKYSKLLPGYENANSIYDLTDSYFGSINCHPESLFTEMKPKSAKTIDTFRWWNYFKSNAPTNDWNHFIKLADRCQKMVDDRTWIHDWKKSKMTNRVSCDIAGTKCYSETNLKEYVLPAWKDAGLKGEPECQIDLERGDRSFGKIFISRFEPRTLVLDADPRTGTHWFDKLQVSFHPKIPNYIIIEPDGKIKKRKISATSKYLPKWARDAIKKGNIW